MRWGPVADHKSPGVWYFSIQSKWDDVFAILLATRQNSNRTENKPRYFTKMASWLAHFAFNVCWIQRQVSEATEGKDDNPGKHRLVNLTLGIGI